MPIREDKKSPFFKKSLGQNILKDKNIIKKIIDLLTVKDGDIIIEIGPGLGALTDELAELDNEIIAIEKDTRFFQTLTERYKKTNILILNEDALNFDYDKLHDKFKKKFKVVGNLPYNISSQILFLLFPLNRCFDRFLFMFQEEVADRIVAKPSTKDYGILSVISQYYSFPCKVISVSRNCFVPPPKIESSVVNFDIYVKPPFPVRDEALFKNVVKTAFSHRRKTLSNCFKDFCDKDGNEIDIKKIFLNADIDPMRRGETLSVEEYVTLTEKFYEEIVGLR